MGKLVKKISLAKTNDMKSLLFVFTFLSSFVWSQGILENEKIIKYQGFFNSYYDDDKGKMYLEVNELDSSFIYVSSLSQGIGNNDLFLDRGQLGGTRIVSFKRAGNKLLLVQPNLAYRAITANQSERISVEQAFAKSVIYGFEIVDKTTDGFLIDITDFLMQDTHGVLDVLKRNKQGMYALDKSRSALNMNRTKSFPNNVDFDVLITLKGNPEGQEIRSVTPDPKYITVYQHHSFVALPDNNYEPRILHPNSGSFSTDFMNYSAGIDEPMLVRFSNRHRLNKKNPEAEVSEPVEPIIYYLDNGTPEPIRSALLDGAGWWNQAFDAIGYKDAFQVKMLPDTIDPLDVRYNVIQWVHRSTRGWSYGMSVTDPRTGEIIKGHVSLGSLRVRQDYKIAKALTNGGDNEEIKEFALSRIRQLGAHEVGHTLGFEHNYAASLNNRASVMDYPHPLVSVIDGKIDISDAYADGIGSWDKVTVDYLYGDHDEVGLKKVLSDALNSGHKHISDQDARPIGSANIHGHLWDNGSNATDELKNVMNVRAAAIDQFNADVLTDGESFHELEDLFVLLYFYHRYQVEAAIKYVGGREYNYGLKGETEIPGKVVGYTEQRRALDEILKTLEADFLVIPEAKMKMFPDRASSNGRDRESFDSKLGLTFDPFTSAESAANFVLERLLHPQRVNRLVTQSSLDQDQLSLDEVLDALIDNVLKKTSTDGYKANLHVLVKESLLTNLIQLAQNADVYPQVSATVNRKLENYKEWLEDLKNMKPTEAEWVRLITNYLEHPQKEIKSTSPRVPDGSPIGSHSCGGYH